MISQIMLKKSFKNRFNSGSYVFDWIKFNCNQSSDYKKRIFNRQLVAIRLKLEKFHNF